LSAYNINYNMVNNNTNNKMTIKSEAVAQMNELIVITFPLLYNICIVRLIYHTSQFKSYITGNFTSYILLYTKDYNKICFVIIFYSLFILYELKENNLINICFCFFHVMF
jgi:hypothetical protein